MKKILKVISFISVFALLNINAVLASGGMTGNLGG
jgi:hypothetical protein